MSMATAPALRGRTIMVVEDELLVAMLIEDALREHGCQLIGPYTTVAEAQRAAEHDPMAAAVLDVNVRGERIYPVAEALARRGIPFVLLSGYGQDAVPADRPGWVACAKPFREAELVAQLQRLLASSAPDDGVPP